MDGITVCRIRGVQSMPRPQTPLIAADIIIRLRDRPDSVVLIERRNPPLGLAIPGGFVDVGERVEAAAVREAREETCLKVSLECLLGLYSDPARDPRGHTVTAVYVAVADGMPCAADDAKAIVIADPADPSLQVVFDHRLVLDDYSRWRRTGQLAPLRC
jgi:8-oxo-dGTP diphosphatase